MGGTQDVTQPQSSGNSVDCLCVVLLSVINTYECQDTVINTVMCNKTCVCWDYKSVITLSTQSLLMGL